MPMFDVVEVIIDELFRLQDLWKYFCVPIFGTLVFKLWFGKIINTSWKLLNVLSRSDDLLGRKIDITICRGIRGYVTFYESRLSRRIAPSKSSLTLTDLCQSEALSIASPLYTPQSISLVDYLQKLIDCSPDAQSLFRENPYCTR